MLLLLVILAAAYFIWRMRTPVSQQRAVERQAEELITRNTAQASNSLRRFAQRFSLGGSNQDKKRIDQIKIWINTNWLSAQSLAADAINGEFQALVAWLNTLNDDDFVLFIQHIDSVAAAQRISLDYILNDSVIPELKTSTEDMLRLCALMVWKSEDIKSLIAYQEWSKAPATYKDQKFVDRLYADLVKAGFVTPNIDALMQTDQQREDHIVSSIRLAATQHGDEFIRILKHSIAHAASSMNNAAIEGAVS